MLCLQSAVEGQAIVDTLSLTPLPPDSFYVRRAGSDIVVGWYPLDDSVSAVVGSYDFRNWYSEHDVSEGSRVTIRGSYIGVVDVTLVVERESATSATVGADTSLILFASVVDPRNRTYRQRMNIGTRHYTTGDRIPLVLVNQEPPFDQMPLGIDLSFGTGVVDTSLIGGLAFFQVDLQDFEGFHIRRGISPFPSDMEVVAELSKEDGYLGVAEDSIYYSQWPKHDDRGRQYYEWTDNNVFVGFTYYYIVSTYDRGYFKGFFQHNKWDSYICEEDDPDFEQHYGPPDGALECPDVAKEITMTVNAGTDITKVYVVPNPYRTGTSEATSPYYHNFPDRSIKFFNVPMNAQIKVYTVSGDLVWEARHSNPDGSDGVVTWDAKNKEGEDVGSGVYVFKCESGDGEQVYGRIVVIR
jgi:hypothetical protein